MGQKPNAQTRTPLSPRMEQLQPGIFLSACLNNLLRELSDPINEPVFPPPSALSTLFCFQMAAELGQLSVYLPTVLTNHQQGAVQPVSQAAGLTNSQNKHKGVGPTMVPLSAGPNTSGEPAGLERPTPEVAKVQTPVEPNIQPTQASIL
uniref:Uncharacterized protein n=1 Tax=Mola mola TaxID=94237 RepID=A0A3Q3WAR5_MOLML